MVRQRQISLGTKLKTLVFFSMYTTRKYLSDTCKHKNACNDELMRTYFDNVFHYVLTKFIRYEYCKFNLNEKLKGSINFLTIKILN